MTPNASAALAAIALIILVLVTSELSYRDAVTSEAVYIEYMADVKKAQENRQ
jgi:hypothetical protein